jgi:hypothetical protein
MLRYAKILNTQISENASIEELTPKIRFLIETEINPALYDLNRDLTNPNRPWHKRLTEGGTTVFSIVLAILTGGFVGQTAAEGIRNAVLSELEGKGLKEEVAKRNGLYYLLKARNRRR